MFDSILWATDGSPGADQSLGRVRELCERYGSSLRIVHVVHQLGCQNLPGPNVLADENRVIAKLKAQTSSLRRHGINASLHVIRGATGSPARHIADMARATDAELIVLGVRGRSPVEAVLSGSVTCRLLATAPCPVLVVPAPRRVDVRPAGNIHPAVATG